MSRAGAGRRAGTGWAGSFGGAEARAQDACTYGHTWPDTDAYRNVRYDHDSHAGRGHVHADRGVDLHAHRDRHVDGDGHDDDDLDGDVDCHFNAGRDTVANRNAEPDFDPHSYRRR